MSEQNKEKPQFDFGEVDESTEVADTGERYAEKTIFTDPKVYLWYETKNYPVTSRDLPVIKLVNYETGVEKSISKGIAEFLMENRSWDYVE